MVKQLYFEPKLNRMRMLATMLGALAGFLLPAAALSFVFWRNGLGVEWICVTFILALILGFLRIATLHKWKGFGFGFKESGNCLFGPVQDAVLFLMYFIALGTTSVIARLAGKKFLLLKPDGKTFYNGKTLKTEDDWRRVRQF
jgi:hypothetical protein